MFGQNVFNVSEKVKESVLIFLIRLFVPLSEIAQVIAPYSATGAEQLTLAPGQLILIRKKNPGGWWEGELQVRIHNSLFEKKICESTFLAPEKRNRETQYHITP